MTRALVALVALVLALSPAVSLAQAPRTNAPPGNSAIDEYVESVPGATGNTPSASAKGGDDGTLSAAQRARLQRAGPDGRTLADALAATSSATPRKSSSESALQGEGRSPISEVVGTVTGSDGGGMGIALPAILVGTLLAAVAVVLVRRRSPS